VTENVQNPPAAGPKKASFSEDFKRFFVRGLATLLPTLITILLLLKIWEILWEYLGQHIIVVLKWLTLYLRPKTEIGWVKWYWEVHLPQWLVECIGVVLAIVVVYIVGLFVGHFIGRTAWRLVEVGLTRIPLIRVIYPAVKQVTDYVLTDRKSHMLKGRVVAVEPHANGIWSIGLVTGSGIRQLSDATSREMVTVFVPSTPTAFAGYVLVVPRDRVVELPLTVEEVMKLLVTGGVAGPGGMFRGMPEVPAPGLPAGEESQNDAAVR